jgi:hypothetical protein
VRQVRSRYTVWQEEKPVWFTPVTPSTLDMHGCKDLRRQALFSQSFIAKLPDDFITDDEVDNLNAASPTGRRMSLETMSVLERVQSSRTLPTMADRPVQPAGELVLEIGPGEL